MAILQQHAADGAARSALLMGSYISSLTPPSVVPEVVAPEVSEMELSAAANALLSEGVIALPSASGTELTIGQDGFLCPYELTDKGKRVFGFGSDLLKTDFSLFKIIVATGGSTVHYHEEKNQITNITTFEQNMIKQIDASSHSEQDKKEAKSKLQEFLAHPLLGTVLGAVLGAALKS